MADLVVGTTPAQKHRRAAAQLNSSERLRMPKGREGEIRGKGKVSYLNGELRDL
jgi:hypothetical protein